MKLFQRGAVWWVRLSGRRVFSTCCHDKGAAHLVAIQIERANVILGMIEEDATGTIVKMIAERLNLRGEAVRMKAPVGARGRVYFVECAEKRLIKIGFATDLTARLRTMRTSATSTIELLGSFEGTRAAERALHQRFLGSRRFGEWFADTPALRAAMAEKLGSQPGYSAPSTNAN